MEELSLDNILTGYDIESLFTDNESQESSSPEEQKEEKDTNSKEEENKEDKETTEVNSEELFQPESVGSEDNEDIEGTSSTKESTPSKFFSSIAKAFVEEGIFPDLDDNLINKVTSAEDFRDLIEDRIKSELDERQKRIDAALNVGVETNIIRLYENTLNYLDSITESAINDESERGETLRKNLIMLDYINRGYSKERAAKAVEKSFKNGDDIDDAREALNGNKEFFKSQYNDVINLAKEAEALAVKERKQQAEQLKTSILTDKKFFGELEVDKQTRQKIYDNITKPVYKDPESGEVLTAIQKYELENRTDFLKNLGLVFTLTDGFKNLDALVKNKVRKEVKKGFRDLENTLNNTSRGSDGNLKFVSGVDPESFIGKGYTLDI